MADEPAGCEHDDVSWDPVEIQYDSEGTADISQIGTCVGCGAPLKIEYFRGELHT